MHALTVALRSHYPENAGQPFRPPIHLKAGIIHATLI